jgi:hypothetical protein
MKRIIPASKIIPCLLFVLTLTVGAFAQTLTGQLSGIVTDQTGAVIPNANITLTNQLNGDIRRTVSNSDGLFAIASVPTGEYTILSKRKASPNGNARDFA